MAAPWYACGHHDKELEYASNSKEPVLPPPTLLYHAADIAKSGPAIGIYTKEADKHVRIRFSVQVRHQSTTAVPNSEQHSDRKSWKST